MFEGINYFQPIQFKKENSNFNCVKIVDSRIFVTGSETGKIQVFSHNSFEANQTQEYQLKQKQGIVKIELIHKYIKMLVQTTSSLLYVENSKEQELIKGISSFQLVNTQDQYLLYVSY